MAKKVRQLEQQAEEDYGILYRKTLIYLCLSGQTITKAGAGILVFVFGVTFLVDYPLGCITIYKAASVDFNVFCDVIHKTNLTLISAVFVWVFVVQRQVVVDLHISAAHEFTQFQSDLSDKQLKPLRKKFVNDKKVAMVGLLVIIICAAMAEGIAPLVDYLLDIQPEKKDLNGINADLPIPCWYPFDTTTGLQLAIALFVQTTAAAGRVLAFTSFDLFLLNMIRHISYQLGLLNTSIRCLPQRILLVEAADGFNFCLKQNMRHHQMILRQFKILQDLTGYSVLTALVSAAALIAFSGVMILRGSSTGGQVKSLIFTCAEMYNLGIACWYAQEISGLSLDLQSSITHYSTWEDRRSKTSLKTVNIFLERTKKPMEYVAVRLTTLNLHTFGKIMNTSYSYFNLMYAVKD